MRLRNTIIILLVLFSQFLLCSCASTKDMRTEGGRYIEEKEPPSSVPEIAPVSITKKEPRKQAVTPYLQISTPEIETITVTHKYVMGDNDSKNDARRMCFLEAKHKVLEKAGIYIESHFSHIISEGSSGNRVKSFQLAKDELYTYAAALLKVDIVKEEWQFVGENMAILMIVKAEVDTNNVENQLSKIKQDTSVQKKIRTQQSRLQELERTVVKLQKQLATVDAPKAATLRKERNIVFKEIDELQAKKIAIVSKIKSKTKRVIAYVELGMTPSEVKSLVGNPRSTTSYGFNPFWNYGNVWIIFEGGVVSCIIRSTCFGKWFKRNDYSKYDRGCIVK